MWNGKKKVYTVYEWWWKTLNIKLRSIIFKLYLNNIITGIQKHTEFIQMWYFLYILIQLLLVHIIVIIKYANTMYVIIELEMAQSLQWASWYFYYFSFIVFLSLLILICFCFPNVDWNIRMGIVLYSFLFTFQVFVQNCIFH